MFRYFTNENLLDRVPKFFYFCGILSFVCNAVGSLLMFEKQDETLILVVNDEEGETKQLLDQNTGEGNEYPTLTLIDALKMKELYIVALIFSFCDKSVNSYMSYYKVSWDPSN